MTSTKVDSKVDSGALKTIVPVEGEPTRFWVPSESEPDGPPWLVDLDDGGLARCSCQIVHNRTESRSECRHIRAVKLHVFLP